MPFGEELYAGTPNRTESLKYSQSGVDNVRKRFTGYEKDTETGLDFAEARYYNNQHGRFTAVDPLLSSGKSSNPQTFNRYIYVMNQPLIATDPSGMQGGTNPDKPLYTPDPDEEIYTVNVRAWARSFFASIFGSPTTMDNVAERSATNYVSKSGGSFFQPNNQLVRQSFYALGERNRQINEGVKFIDPTGIASLNETTVKASLGHASNSDLAFEYGKFGVNVASTLIGGGISRGTTTATREIALGFEQYGGKMVLTDLAEQTGASAFKRWAADGITRKSVDSHFGRAFWQAANRADRIHFALDGIIDSKIGIEGAINLGRRGFTQAGGNKFTYAELNTIYRNRQFFEKTQFYFQGRPVSPLFRPY